MNLNIREMLEGGPSRLRYVFRYSTSRVQYPESVAEHSYYVTLYSLLIAHWVNYNYHHPDDFNPKTWVNTEYVLEKAIIHDLEEAQTGDFPRPFKHSTPQLQKMLEDAAATGFDQVLAPLIGPCQVAGVLRSQWRTAKDGTTEGNIVSFADFLGVLAFMAQECRGGGNRTIDRHVLEVGRYYSTFLSPQFNFIRPLVEQAGELMKEVFNVEAADQPTSDPEEASVTTRGDT